MHHIEGKKVLKTNSLVVYSVCVHVSVHPWSRGWTLIRSGAELLAVVCMVAVCGARAFADKVAAAAAVLGFQMPLMDFHSHRCKWAFFPLRALMLISPTARSF